MLKQYKDKHKGEACIIIGNGPSLRNTPRDLLEAFTSFGANKIFLLQEIDGYEGFVPDYYTIIDIDMLHDCTQQLANGYKPGAMFLPRGVPVSGAHQMTLAAEHDFSRDISKKVVMGGTVTYANLQIAYYMGFKEAFLVGVDHSYEKYNGRPGTKFIAEGDDPDHFHPNYFKEGRMYNTWERDGMEKMYRLARRVWESDGRKIINLTPGTMLENIPRADMEAVLDVVHAQ